MCFELYLYLKISSKHEGFKRCAMSSLSAVTFRKRHHSLLSREILTNNNRLQSGTGLAALIKPMPQFDVSRNSQVVPPPFLFGGRLSLLSLPPPRFFLLIFSYQRVTRRRGRIKITLSTPSHMPFGSGSPAKSKRG